MVERLMNDTTFGVHVLAQQSPDSVSPTQFIPTAVLGLTHRNTGQVALTIFFELTFRVIY